MNGRIKKRIEGREAKTTALTVVGKIKIGMKHPEKGYPMAIDHFVCACENAQYKQMFSDAYGQKPNALKIVFPSDTLSDMCANYYEIRDKEGKLFASGDGENFKVALKKADGKVEMVAYNLDKIESEYKTVELFMERIKTKLTTEKHKAEWKEKLTLRFVIVGINITGLWQLDTSASESSIPAMIAMIDGIVEKTGGRLSDIPFDLIVSMQKSDKSGESRRYPVIKIVCNYSPDDIRAVASLPTSKFFGILTSERLKEIGTSESNALLLNAENGNVEDIEHEEA